MRGRIVPALLAAVVLGTTACDMLFDESDHTYTGPPQVEFAPVLPAGNYVRTVVFTAGNQGTQTTNVRVNYIAAPPSAPVTGEITVVDASTAVDGTHYRFTSGRQYTIPAGANFVDVPIELLGAGLANGASVNLVLELAPGTGFGVAEKYKRFTITSRKNAS